MFRVSLTSYLFKSSRSTYWSKSQIFKYLLSTWKDQETSYQYLLIITGMSWMQKNKITIMILFGTPHINSILPCGLMTQIWLRSIWVSTLSKGLMKKMWENNFRSTLKQISSIKLFTKWGWQRERVWLISILYSQWERKLHWRTTRSWQSLIKTKESSKLTNLSCWNFKLKTSQK